MCVCVCVCVCVCMCVLIGVIMIDRRRKFPDDGHTTKDSETNKKFSVRKLTRRESDTVPRRDSLFKWKKTLWN